MMEAMKISDLIPDITAVQNAFQTGFTSVNATYETADLTFYCEWFKDYVYRKYKSSFILSFKDEEAAWNKMYTFYICHIAEFQKVQQLWEDNYDKLMNGITSSSKVASKVSGTPQDGSSYVEDYPDTETLQTSESNQSDKSVLAKLQELTKKLTSYKKTWAEMFRKEMGLWIAL